MRAAVLLSVVGAGTAAPLATPAPADAPQIEPPQCPANSKKPTAVRAGEGSDGEPLYIRACGPARASVNVQGLTYEVRGGFCQLLKVQLLPTGEVSPHWMLSVATGLISNRPAAHLGPAVWLNIETGRRVRPGPAPIIDAIVEVPPTQPAPHAQEIERGRLLAGASAVITRADSPPIGMAILRPRLRGGVFVLAEPPAAGTARGTITGSWTCR
jgi:hypothetical protein